MRNLDARDVTIYQGIRVTTVPRTLVDLAATFTPHRLANVIHEAAFRNRLSVASTNATMARAQGRPLTTLHAALQATPQAAPAPSPIWRTSSSRAWRQNRW